MNYFKYDYLYPVTGADISGYQRRPGEEIDVDLLVSRVNFLILRGLYTSYEDADFSYFIGKLVPYDDLPLQFYQYLKIKDSSTAMQRQFDALRRLVDDYDMPKMGLMLDVERNDDNLDKMKFGDQYAKYLNWGFQEWGEEYFTTYTRTSFWDAVLRGYKTDYPKKTKLHVARYHIGVPVPADDNYALPRDWEDLSNPPYGVKWVQWQFSADGNDLGAKFGVQSDDIDLNRFNGDWEDFKHMYGVYPRKATNPLGGEVTPPPTDKPLEFVINKAKCTAYALNVRRGPSTSQGIVEKLYQNDIVEVLETKETANEKWLRIGKNQWSAMEYYNNKYMEYLK